MEKEFKARSSKKTVKEDSNCDSKDVDYNLSVTHAVTDDGGNNDKVTSISNEFPDGNMELLESQHENTCDEKIVEGLAELSLTEERLPSEERDSECTPEGNAGQHIQTIDKDAEIDNTEEIEKVRLSA